jgi:hypothetical protein
LKQSSLSGQWLAAAVFLAAAVCAAAAVMAMGSARPLEADAPYYWAIAQSLAAGKGFVNAIGPWPDLPTAERLPVWPLLMAPFTLISHSPATARFAAVFYHSLTAMAVFLLAMRLCRRPGPALAAGLLAGANPVSLYLVTLAMSETVCLLVLTTGMLLLLDGRRPMAGAIILGAAAVTRANLILLPVAALAVAACFAQGRNAMRAPGAIRRYATLAAAFWLLPACWIGRNYVHFSEFPLITSLEGETLYGATNSAVAGNLAEWGYWIMPDHIPGETPKLQLGRAMSETQLNRYYRGKAAAYLKQNWFSMPRLIAGRLVRAYFPVPWAPSWPSYASFACRGLLMAAALVTLPLWWTRLDRSYLLLLAALTFINIITTVVYYGNYRFTYVAAEFFLIPVLAVSLNAWIARRAAPEPRAAAAGRS